MDPGHRAHERLWAGEPADQAAAHARSGALGHPRTVPQAGGISRQDQSERGLPVGISAQDARSADWSVNARHHHRVDMPRPTTEPQDVLVDAQGMVWYSDFGELFISMFDPKTLKLTEYPVKEFKSGAPVGNLSLEWDKRGTLWFDTMFQGSLGNLDPKTGQIKYYPLAPEYNDNRVQLNFVGLRL